MFPQISSLILSPLVHSGVRYRMQTFISPQLWHQLEHLLLIMETWFSFIGSPEQARTYMRVQIELKMPLAHPLENLIGLDFGFRVNCFHLPRILWMVLTYTACQEWKSTEAN